MMSRVEQLCVERGLKMTEQRRIIARVLSAASDHPDANAVYRRATSIDPRISMATVYRTIRLFEEANVLQRHEFAESGGGAGARKARYEEMTEEHHDHLIDVTSGKVIEFQNDEIERLQKEVARKLGFNLVDHRLELYGTPIDDGDDKKR
jgi:Fur family ferric uptake transcriptional regulator